MVAMLRSSQMAHFAVWICTGVNSSGSEEQSMMPDPVLPAPGVDDGLPPLVGGRGDDISQEVYAGGSAWVVSKADLAYTWSAGA
jgi:hypothetical protein